MNNVITHPDHYTSRDIGYECISLAECQRFCTGNAIKYLWRYKDKGAPGKDLKKARWYARRATMRQERTDTTGRCESILRQLITSTTGSEKAAWRGLMQSDWKSVIEALNRLIKKEDE